MKLRQPLRSLLFPYTTLFRSHQPWSARCARRGHGLQWPPAARSEEHTSELQSRFDIVCRILLEKKMKKTNNNHKKTTMSANKTMIRQRKFKMRNKSYTLMISQ